MVNNEMNSIVCDILSDPLQKVTSAHLKSMLQLFTKSFLCFKAALLALIEKIFTLEDKDTLIKGLYKLLEWFYSEAAKSSQGLGMICDYYIVCIVELNTLVGSLIDTFAEAYWMTKVGP